MKVIYKELFKDQLQGLVLPTPCKITYTYFSNSNRKSDISNMCVVIDKFFCDCLTEFGCIPDDNYEFIKEVVYLFGGVDKGKGRVEIQIEEH
jgi:Holliday junction resolvase RusA-like endonuclease